MGDLVKYEFRTLTGKELKIGLIMGDSQWLNVWRVYGLNGEEHHIHDAYLYGLSKGKE